MAQLSCRSRDSDTVLLTQLSVARNAVNTGLSEGPWCGGPEGGFFAIRRVKVVDEEGLSTGTETEADADALVTKEPLGGIVSGKRRSSLRIIIPVDVRSSLLARQKLLGAEYVRSIELKVTKVKTGNAVLLIFAFCSRCWNCQYGTSGYCESFAQIKFTGRQDEIVIAEGGSIGGFFVGQSRFARLSRTQETSVVHVTGLVRDMEELNLSMPLGCGIQVFSSSETNVV
ncbi:hypothetical protein BDV12DRAFT_29048 [Aspergillus spectabilis]